ncbi:hypothetical protein IFR05_001701 [Cadophora sp. M221]|nr:hypothetical protein IFR05_001701 [Cadophora sp. M221]
MSPEEAKQVDEKRVKTETPRKLKTEVTVTVASASGILGGPDNAAEVVESSIGPI